MISYEDFDLRIRADGAGFVVSAQRGSQSASVPFELDHSRCWDLWQLERRGPKETREHGSALFDSLIRGSVRDLYQQARGGVGGDSDRGLRIRIMIDPRDERMRPLLRLPWEILFERSADSGHLPALDPRRPIVRTIDSIEQSLSPAPGRLRRVLLVLSNPIDSELLDLEDERAGVEEALGRFRIYPEVLRGTTRSRLFDSMSDGEPQVVHFMGHGDFDAAIGEGVLLLEDEYGRADLLRASTLATFFAGKPMPRLVILAACLSADPGHDSALGPFTGVAAALVAAGLPAVIAMQTKVRDRSAVRFTERLYRRLAAGDPVEAAVADARRALRAGQPGTLDWAAPVLFVRGQQGTPIAESDSPKPKPLQPQRTEIRQSISNRDIRGIQVNIAYQQGGKPTGKW